MLSSYGNWRAGNSVFVELRCWIMWLNHSTTSLDHGDLPTSPELHGRELRVHNLLAQPSRCTAKNSRLILGVTGR